MQINSHLVMARTQQNNRTKAVPERASKKRQSTIIPGLSTMSKTVTAGQAPLRAKSARNTRITSIPQRENPIRIGSPPDPSDDLITITTPSFERHGAFELSRQLLRDRSPLVDAKCLEITSQHLDRLAASAAPVSGARPRRGRPPAHQIQQSDIPRPDYILDFPDVKYYIFASYVHLLTTDTIELDFPFAPLKSVDEAWKRLVKLYLLCEKLEDEVSMGMVSDAAREHLEVEFPSEGGVRLAYNWTTGNESVLRRLLVDQVLENWSDGEVTELVLEETGSGWRHLKEDVVRRLVEGRSISRSAPKRDERA
ncbi:uncharacterized protein RHO25_003124 [Cercospora beticola]|uniref:Uncharacterized protein n=2 Tax=Cercospora beticola TaxID=122368 RepID=A0ABZ0NG58_CERBT|nr:hypothetical protein RHO25_003124 [Cercospora beticola]